MSDIILFILFLFDIVIFVDGFRNKEMSSPASLFSALWSVILLLYFIGGTKWYPIRVSSALIIFFGNLSFYYATKLGRRKVNRTAYNNTNTNFNLLSHKKVFYVLVLLSLYFLYDEVRGNISTLLMGNDFNDITNQKTIDGTSITSVLSGFFSILVMHPMVYAVCPIVAIEIILGKRRPLVIILCFLLITFNVMIAGKRSMVIFLFISFLVVWLLYKENVSIAKKIITGRNLLLIGIGLIVFWCISWLSSMRETSLGDSYYSYFSGGIVSFDQRTLRLDDHFYGAGFLYGLLSPIMIAFKGVLHMALPDWWIELVNLCESADQINIGRNISFNAFNTWYYIPYIDGGAIGVIIEMFIIGLIVQNLYLEVKRCPTIKNVAFYSMSIIGIYGSMYTLFTSQYPFLLSFFYLYFLCDKKSLSYH